MYVRVLTFLATVVGIIMSFGHSMQAFKILERKSAKDVSVATYVVFTVGAYIWLAYGLAIKDIPIIASFTIAAFGTTFVMVLIKKYG